MSFTEDNLTSKLSTLNETQESIVGVSQWILFYRRYAADTARVWADYILRAPMSKRLALVYLTNEVVQQAKAKKKLEFIDAFSTVIASTLEAVYNNASHDTKKRIERVVTVWAERQVFPQSSIDDLRSRINIQPGNGSNISARQPSSSSVSAGSSSLLSRPQQHLNRDLQALNSWLDVVAGAQYTVDREIPSLLSECTSNLDSEHLPAPEPYLKILESLNTRMEKGQQTVQSLVESQRALIDEINSFLQKQQHSLSANEALLEQVGDSKHRLTLSLHEISEMVGGSGQDADEYEPGAPQDTASGNVDDNEIPAYSNFSSDEEEVEPESKRAKTEAKSDEKNAASQSVEGLNPDVAAFLSSLKGGSSLLM